MLLAIDTGLATCGAAVFEDGGAFIDADVFLCPPKKRPSKDIVGAWEATDLSRRGQKLSEWLLDIRRRSAGQRMRAVAEAVNVSRQAHTLATQQHASGCVSFFSVACGVPLEWTLPTEWRAFLGWFSTPTRGMSKAERERTKRTDDARLYTMLKTLPGAADLLRFTSAHGRTAAQSVHAWDAFGIGRAALRPALRSAA